MNIYVVVWNLDLQPQKCFNWFYDEYYYSKALKDRQKLTYGEKDVFSFTLRVSEDMPVDEIADFVNQILN